MRNVKKKLQKTKKPGVFNSCLSTWVYIRDMIVSYLYLYLHILHICVYMYVPIYVYHKNCIPRTEYHLISLGCRHLNICWLVCLSGCSYTSGIETFWYDGARENPVNFSIVCLTFLGISKNLVIKLRQTKSN